MYNAMRLGTDANSVDGQTPAYGLLRRKVIILSRSWGSQSPSIFLELAVVTHQGRNKAAVLSRRARLLLLLGQGGGFFGRDQVQALVSVGIVHLRPPPRRGSGRRCAT